MVTQPHHDIKRAIDLAARALGDPIGLRSLESNGAAIGAVGRWRHGDAIYERPASSCFQLVMNISGGHVVDQVTQGLRQSARIEEGTVGMLVPDRASIVRVTGSADIVVMFLDRKLIPGERQADDELPIDCFQLSSMDFYTALTRVLVTFGLSQERALDTLAVAVAHATRGVAQHQSLAVRQHRRGGLSPHVQKGLDAAIEGWFDKAEGPPPRLQTLAAIAGLSPSHFLRSFFLETGATPGKAIQTLRLRQALRLLLGTNMPVSEIGESLGYSSPSHFIDAFKRAVGATPGTVRSAAKVA